MGLEIPNILKITLSENDMVRLNNLSKETNRPKSFYIRKLIHDYLDEDYEQKKLRLIMTRKSEKNHEKLKIKKHENR